MEHSFLQVGFGRESIMPGKPVPLGGGDATRRIYTYIKDEVFITCVALKEAQQTILLFTSDTLNSNENFSTPAREFVSNAIGIPVEQILLSGTHTHAGVAISVDSWDGVAQYRQFFYEAAVRAAKTALADLAKADVYYGSTETERMTFVRHYRLADGSYAGPNFGDFKKAPVVGHATEADGQLQLVKFAREGKKDVLMMNFPAHGTFSSIQDTYLSADFPSPTRAYIEANSDCLVAYFIAAAGNQTPNSQIDGESPYKKQYLEYGKALGQYTLAAMAHLTRLEDGHLKHAAKTVVCAPNKEKLHLLPYAQEVVDAGSQLGSLHPDVIALARKNGFSSRFEASAIINRAKLPDQMYMTLNVLTIGKLGFIFAPYEMFGAQGQHIKKHAPCDMTFIVTCSGGAKGYLPDRFGFQIGCYESCTTRYTPGTAETLADTFVDMLLEIGK